MSHNPDGTLLPNIVTTAKIADGNVTAVKLLDGSVSNVKLAADVSPVKFANPYKFSVYRTAALNSAASFAVIAFDTKTGAGAYDTGNNVDVVTNKGRFTAPVAGFYFFSAAAGNNVVVNSSLGIQIYKNGTPVKNGTVLASGGAAGTFVGVSGSLQLAVNDYVEIAFVGSGGGAMGVGVTNCFFDGFLMSAT